jgi:hypothetical protein
MVGTAEIKAGAGAGVKPGLSVGSVVPAFACVQSEALPFSYIKRRDVPTFTSAPISGVPR